MKEEEETKKKEGRRRKDCEETRPAAACRLMLTLCVPDPRGSKS